jgi:hypothetical protein
VKAVVTLEEYRSRLVKLRLAYLELLEGPRLSATNASTVLDQLSVISNDLIQFAEDMMREIQDMKQLLTGRSEFPDSQVPGYQQLLLDASTLAQRVDASLRQTNRFVYRSHTLAGASESGYNGGSGPKR